MFFFFFFPLKKSQFQQKKYFKKAHVWWVLKLRGTTTPYLQKIQNVYPKIDKKVKNKFAPYVKCTPISLAKASSLFLLLHQFFKYSFYLYILLKKKTEKKDSKFLAFSLHICQLFLCHLLQILTSPESQSQVFFKFQVTPHILCCFFFFVFKYVYFLFLHLIWSCYWIWEPICFW